MTNKNHIHKYKRISMGEKKIISEYDPILKRNIKKVIKNKEASIAYRCMIPGCNHKVNREEMEGRECICWNCGGLLIITSEILSAKGGGLLHPRHYGCRKKRIDEDLNLLSSSERIGLLT